MGSGLRLWLSRPFDDSSIEIRHVLVLLEIPAVITCDVIANGNNADEVIIGEFHTLKPLPMANYSPCQLVECVRRSLSAGENQTTCRACGAANRDSGDSGDVAYGVRTQSPDDSIKPTPFRGVTRLRVGRQCSAQGTELTTFTDCTEK